MARLGRVKLLEIDLSSASERAFGRLRQAKGFTQVAQRRMAQEMRPVIERLLNNVIQDSSFPVRTGKSKANSRAKGFGTSFTSMRGHIVGPANIKVLNEGAEIEPTQGEYLAIPFGNAVRPDGTPKLPGPRSWQNILPTFVYKSKKTGQRYIAYKVEGDEARIECLYVLVETASVKPRRFLDRAWDRQKGALGREFGNIMVSELARIDIMQMARVTYKGKPK